MACPICGIELPDEHEDFVPCSIAPRYYVSEWGFIVAVIDSCPYEPERQPDYVPNDIIPRISVKQRAAMEDRAEELVNAKSYEDLWTSRHGKNYHLNFDAQSRLGIWSASNSGSLHNPYKSRVPRSKKSRRKPAKNK